MGKRPPAITTLFVRSVDAFPVHDENGRAYNPPFLGGFNVPRPQFADIDGDGDIDLFLQERPGELMLFENVGGPARPEFVWRTDRYQNLSVGEWTRFVDFDRDGDLDLLSEGGCSATCSTSVMTARLVLRPSPRLGIPCGTSRASPFSRIARTFPTSTTSTVMATGIFSSVASLAHSAATRWPR